MKYIRSYNKFKKEELNEELNEGLKEWLLGGLITLSSMAGIGQTFKPGVEFNKEKIEAAEKVQDKIKSGDKDIIDLFSDAELELNDKNLEKLKSIDLDKKAKKTMDVYKLKNKRIVGEKLKQGYVLSDVKVSYDTIIEPNDSIILDSIIELEFDSDVVFKTAGFELSDDYKSELESTIKELKEKDFLIKNITVESSTDKEPIKMGNDKLAQKRSNSVVNVLNDMGYDNIGIKNLPDQGPDIYTKTMSSEERVLSREKTSEFRYVKVTIEYEVEIETAPQPIEEVVKKHKYELVKGKVDNRKMPKTRKGKNLKRKVHVKSGTVVNKRIKKLTTCNMPSN